MIIGIDPGITGGIAIIKNTDVILHKIPTIERSAKKEVDVISLYEILASCQATIYIERVWSMPKQGVSSMFSFGKTFGMILATAVLTENRIILVMPKTWQKAIHGKAKGDAKERTLKAIKKLYPNVSLLATPRSSKPHGGLVDALAIAHYGLLSEGKL